MNKIILILMFSISLMSYSSSINQKKSKNTKVVAYCENGKIMYKGKFKNGKKDGEWITYYKADKIKSKGNFKDGKKDGKWITYDKNGKIKSKEIYNDGKKVRYDTVSRFSHSSKTKVTN